MQGALIHSEIKANGIFMIEDIAIDIRVPVNLPSPSLLARWRRRYRVEAEGLCTDRVLPYTGDTPDGTQCNASDETGSGSDFDSLDSGGGVVTPVGQEVMLYRKPESI